MRLPLALILCLFLVGCPAPKPPATGAPEQTPTSTPSPTPAATPAPTPTPLENIGQNVEISKFVGVWTTVDDKGQLFDILLFANGQAVTNWTKGKDGAQGERGFWRKDGGKVIAVFDDGWSDVITPEGEEFRHRGYAPGVALDGTPTNSAEITRVPEPLAQYVGVWRLNKEPDGSYQYVTLQSNGRAYSSVSGGTEGKWTVTEKGAECKWPDGWVDSIERSNREWQKRSWIGTDSSTPADLSPASRVGETRLIANPL